MIRNISGMFIPGPPAPSFTPSQPKLSLDCIRKLSAACEEHGIPFETALDWIEMAIRSYRGEAI
jgi:hypothetical protein